MMTKTLFAALTIALSSTAFAASANSQLALSLGVEPGQFSTAELIQLRDAKESNDATRVKFILGGSEQAEVMQSTKLQAFAVTGDFDRADSQALSAFAASISGDKAVSDQTRAFAQTHFASSIEDEN